MTGFLTSKKIFKTSKNVEYKISVLGKALFYNILMKATKSLYIKNVLNQFGVLTKRKFLLLYNVVTIL